MATSTIARLKRDLGKRAFRVLLKRGYVGTKSDLMEQVVRRYRRRGRSLQWTLDASIQLIQELDAARRGARTPAAERRKCFDRRCFRSSCWPREEGPSLSDRLVHRRQKVVASLVNKHLHTYVRQSHTRVEVAEEFTATGAQLTLQEGWVEYSRRFGSRPGIVDAWYSITVARGWLLLPPELRCVDGLITLAAIPVETADPAEHAYRARWVRQKQGGVTVDTGYIILRGRYSAHGRTLGAARGSITRQLPEAQAAFSERARARAEKREKCRQRILQRLSEGAANGALEVEVSLRHSDAVGNCRAGAQHWLAMHFPDVDPRGTLPVRELLAVEDQHDRVLLACAEAVRRAQA